MLKVKLKDHNVILASGSPRRQQFFKDLDLDFEIRLKDVAEIYPSHLKAHQITDFLAELKANAFENELHENDILITSDTIVWLNNEALGKPKDYDDAFKMLSALSNATHEVFTSFCIKTLEKTVTFNEGTKVTFNKLSPASIQYYLENYQPYDKAGGYGIQDWIGLIGVSKIEGSYTNVMGLPTAKIFEYLNAIVP
jgi:septum formation protein